MINILYTSFNEPLPDLLLKKYVDKLPLELKILNEKYVKWEDRHAHLLGKMLLIYSLEYYDFNIKGLDSIKTDNFGRAYLGSSPKISFNISHSEMFVVCAISNTERVGIDLEKIKEVDLKIFEPVFRPIEWETIKSSDNQLKTFFKLWTFKESAAKADGRGLSIPMKALEIHGNHIKHEENIWYLKSIDISNNFACTLATANDVDQAKITIKRIDFHEDLL